MKATKRCKGCEIEKPLSEYYKHTASKDGLRGKCIPCFKTQNSAWNKKNNWTLKAREWEENNREQYLARHREQAKRHEAKYPLEVSVRAKTRWAIYSGKLTRKPCKECGVEKVHAHHPDYSKPFEVMWLCAKHHYDIHHKNNSINVNV